MPTSLPNLEGADRFQLIGKIGEGGMGVVYEAFDKDRGIPVALKTLRRVSPTALYMFKQEFRSIAGIAHPNLVALYELFAGSPENWFFTMELLRGPLLLDYLRSDCHSPEFRMPTIPDSDPDSPTSAPTSPFNHLTPTAGHSSASSQTLNGIPSENQMRELLRKGSAPDPVLVRKVLRQIVEGVSTLHAANKLHRDIKPTNVIINEGGEAKVLDFGLAVDEVALRESGVYDVVGTSAYMAPEQATGRPVSPASDWYAVGVMLYQILCGESPFHGSFRQTTDAKLQRAFRRPSEIADDVDPALEDLTLSLLNIDPTHRPDSAQILSILSARDSMPRSPRRLAPLAASFYGREREQARIEEAMNASISGAVAFALVHGASGVGKSTLMQHYVQGRSKDELILRGRCYEQESVPYKAIDSAVDALCEHLITLPRKELAAMMPADISLLAQLFPVVNRLNERVLFPAASTASDARRIRRRSVQAMRELLTHLRSERPVILTIDDLQWGDVDSVLLLGEIFAHPDPPPLLVLCTYRREYLDRSPCLAAIFEMQKANPAIRWVDVAVEPFSSQESRDFAQSLLKDVSISEAVASRIAKESGGNPYFAVELARYANGLSGDEALTVSADSLRIDNLLRDRISSLDKASRDLLEVVAVHSQPLAQADAYRAAGFTSRDPAPLNALRLANLLRSTGFNQEDQVESFHDRVRDAVLKGLPDDHRRELHSALAETLETSGRGDAESLAMHNERAGDRIKAGHYHELAGDRAAAALAFDRAASHYRSCLELLDAEAMQQSILRAKLGEALVNSGRSIEAAREFETAALFAGDTAKVDFERRAGFYYSAGGHIPEGNAILECVLARVGLKFPKTKRAILFSLLGTSLKLRFQGKHFRERDPKTVPQILLDRFDAAWSVALPLSLTDTAQAMNFGLQALSFAMKAGDPVRFVHGLEYAYVLSLQGGESRDRAAALIATGREIVAKRQDPNLEGILDLVQGSIAFTRANWSECSRYLEHAEEIFGNRVQGGYSHLAQVRTLHMYSQWSAGDFDKIALRYPSFLQEAEQLGDLFSSVNIRSFGLPLIHLMSARPDLARESVTTGLKDWPAASYQLIHAMAAILLSWTAFYEGHAAGNLNYVEEQWARIHANDIDRFDTMRATTLDFRLRTALAAANQPGATPDQRKRALKIARESRRTLSRESNKWGRASAAVAQAAFEESEGNIDTAARSFLAAAERFLETGMVGFAWSARRRAGQLMCNDEGRKFIEAADEWFQSQSVQEPERFAAMHVGGFAAHELT